MATLVWKKTAAGKRYPYVVYQDGPKQIWVSLSRYARAQGFPGDQITTQRGINGAQEWFRHWLKYGRRRQQQVISSDTDLTSFCIDYQRRGEAHKSPNTLKSDASRIKVMMAWLADRGISRLEQITAQVIDDFRTWKIKDGATPTTVNRYIEILRNMLNLAVRDGLIDENPAAGIKMLPARGRRQIRALSDQEVKIIENDFPEPERTFCLFGLYAGLRRAEIVNLEWTDIGRGTITIQAKPGFSPKGIEPRTIPTAPILERALARIQPRHRYIFDDGGGNPVYSVNRWYKLIVEGLFQHHDIKGNLHTLRHTFCTRLVRAGVSLPIVQQLARHRDYKTTLKYSHIDQEDLREALNKIPS